MRQIRLLTLSLAFLLSGICAVSAAASDDPVDLSQYGILYERYEPTFYTGFAPRAEDPARLHLHVGRGNQLRITLVLSDRVLDEYSGDLLVRYQTYRRLSDNGKVKLTQNSGFETFEQTLEGERLLDLVAAEPSLSAEALRMRNLELMERLNPSRIFRIRIPVDELIRRWVAGVVPEDRQSMSKARQLELLNKMLPTRLWVTQLDAADTKALKALIGKIPESHVSGLDRVTDSYLELLDALTGGIYPRNGAYLDFAEFTALHPVGTFNAYTNHKGRKIPQYPTPGRRALTYHQRTKTVDHIPDVSVYSYSPWIPYMHVGKRLHNSFHTLWWRMNPGSTKCDGLCDAEGLADLSVGATGHHPVPQRFPADVFEAQQQPIAPVFEPQRMDDAVEIGKGAGDVVFVAVTGQLFGLGIFGVHRLEYDRSAIPLSLGAVEAGDRSLGDALRNAVASDGWVGMAHRLESSNMILPGFVVIHSSEIFATNQCDGPLPSSYLSISGRSIPVPYFRHRRI